MCYLMHNIALENSCETQLIERVNDFVEITNEGGQTDVIALNL